MARERIWLNDFHEAMENLHVVERELDRLSAAFEITGNEKVAVDLEYLARRIERAHGKARSAVHEEVHESARESEKMTYGLLAVAMKVMK